MIYSIYKNSNLTYRVIMIEDKYNNQMYRIEGINHLGRNYSFSENNKKRQEEKMMKE